MLKLLSVWTFMAPTDAAISDRTSMVYSGTLVNYGQSIGVVVTTGAATEIGHISTMPEHLAGPAVFLLTTYQFLITEQMR